MKPEEEKLIREFLDLQDEKVEDNLWTALMWMVNYYGIYFSMGHNYNGKDYYCKLYRLKEGKYIITGDAIGVTIEEAMTKSIVLGIQWCNSQPKPVMP